MNILLVCDYFPPHIGGVEKVFGRLAELFAEKGHSVSVLSSADIKSPSFLKRFFFLVCGFPRALSLARHSDVIQTTFFAAAPLAWLCSRLLKKHCVLMVHEVIGERWKTLDLGFFAAQIYGGIEKLLFLLPFDHYVCVSNACRNDLLALKPYLRVKSSVIHHGVDLPATARSAAYGKGLSPRFTVTYFGRPGATKGVPVLLKALSLVQKKIPTVLLRLILSKEPAKGYRKVLVLIKRLGLASQVELVPSLPSKKLPRTLLGSHGIVVPSLTEGFGFSAVEACSLGLPLVTSDAGSLPEVVYGRVIFTRAGDATDLARGIFDLYERKWTKIPKKTFSWDHAAEAYLELYSHLSRVQKSRLLH